MRKCGNLGIYAAQVKKDLEKRERLNLQLTKDSIDQIKTSVDKKYTQFLSNIDRLNRIDDEIEDIFYKLS